MHGEVNSLRKTTVPILFLCLGLSLSTSSPAAPNDATVTFYSGGSLPQTGLPGSKHGVFAHGAIFDGEQRLAVLRRRKFVTIRFAPGEHIFSASYSGKHPATNSHLSLTLEPEKNYFVRAESESKGIVVVEFQKGRLDSVGCEDAHAELTKADALEKKHVSAAVIDRLLTSFPACQ
jgi:hypothetical protein